MTKDEYREYEAAVADFFETEGIANLSGGYIECPECNEEWDDNGNCPECGGNRESWEEPSFSHSPCECCGREAGNREHATGYNREYDTILEYEVCEDCIYYAEYGRLDDMTMMELGE